MQITQLNELIYIYQEIDKIIEEIENGGNIHE